VARIGWPSDKPVAPTVSARLTRCVARCVAEMKNPPWPIELKWPIVVDEIVNTILVKSIPPPRGFSELDIDVTNAISEEMDRRVEILSKFLGTEVPKSSDEWLELLDAVCRHWSIPAFRLEQSKPRGPGATKIWTDQKHCELFADVMRLSKGALSDLGACKFIARKPRQFGPRYLPRKGIKSEAWAKTLHRQFLTAKKKIQSDQFFRTVHFSINTKRPALDYGPEFVNLAIKRYAYTRISSEPNSA
jgi:hypothetical protein